MKGLSRVKGRAHGVDRVQPVRQRNSAVQLRHACSGELDVTIPREATDPSPIRPPVSDSGSWRATILSYIG